MITLSPAELVALTKRERPSAQARMLRHMGIPFRVHPIDNVLQVARTAAAAYLGSLQAAANDEPPVEYSVNVTALRAKNGAKTQAR